VTPTWVQNEKTDVDHPNVVNENELEWGEQSHGEKFGHRRKSLSSVTWGEKLGCTLYEVPPARRGGREVTWWQQKAAPGEVPGAVPFE